MKPKNLIILSMLALLAASLTLGCTGSNSANNPTPVATASDIVTDNNQTVAPTDTPIPVDTVPPTDIITNGSSDQGNTSEGSYYGGASPYPYDNSTQNDTGSV